MIDELFDVIDQQDHLLQSYAGLLDVTDARHRLELADVRASSDLGTDAQALDADDVARLALLDRFWKLAGDESENIAQLLHEGPESTEDLERVKTLLRLILLETGHREILRRKTELQELRHDLVIEND